MKKSLRETFLKTDDKQTLIEFVIKYHYTPAFQSRPFNYRPSSLAISRRWLVQ